VRPSDLKFEVRDFTGIRPGKHREGDGEGDVQDGEGDGRRGGRS
jgi:hypothetical protein